MLSINQKMVRTCYHTVLITIRQIFSVCLMFHLTKEVFKNFLMIHTFLRTVFMKKTYNVFYFAEIFCRNIMSLLSTLNWFKHCSGASIVVFEQVNAG